jgi:hypothetical protein
MPDTRTGNVDIERMSRESHIPILFIKSALRISHETIEECTATTVEETKVAWSASPYGSEARKAALLKWIELSTTAEEARSAYSVSPGGSELEKAAIRKIATFYTT